MAPLKTTPRERSGNSIGWRPASLKSKMARRRWPSTTPGQHSTPSLSGPRRASALGGLELPPPERARLAVRVTEDGYPSVGLLAQPTIRFLDLPLAVFVGRKTENAVRHRVGTERRPELGRAAQVVPADGRERRGRAGRQLHVQLP